MKGFFRRAFGIDLTHWLFGENYYTIWLIIILVVAVVAFLYYLRSTSNSTSSHSENLNYLNKRFRSLVYTLYGADSASYVTEHIISKNKRLKYGGLSRGRKDDYFLLQINEYWYKRLKDGTPLTEEKLMQLNEELSLLFEGKTKDVPKLALDQYVIIEFRIYDDEYLEDILSKFKTCKSFGDAHFDKWKS